MGEERHFNWGFLEILLVADQPEGFFGHVSDRRSNGKQVY